MKTALITGGLGFIGTHIAINLLKNKKVQKCVLLDNFGGYMNPTKKNFYDFSSFGLWSWEKIRKFN